MTSLPRRGLAAVPLLLAAPAVHAQALRPVRIAGGLAAEAPQFAVALDRGLIREAGINAAVTNFASGREAFEALVGGQVDLALLTEFPAVVGALRGQRFGIVAITARFKSSRIIAKKRPGIDDRVASLAGRKLGVTVGTNTHFMVVQELAKAGVQAEIVNVGPADLIPALVRGDIEAAATFPSFYAGARRALGADYLEMRVTTYQPTFVIAASELYATGEAETTSRFLAALVKAEQSIAADLPAAQAAVARVAGRAQSPEAIRDGWDDFDIRLALDRALLELMQREGHWLVERGAVRGVDPTEATFSAVIAPAPLRTVAPDRVAM